MLIRGPRARQPTKTCCPAAPCRVVPLRMKKLFVLIGTTIGSYVGWWIGARVGTMTAFIVSMIGTGIGMYLGIKYAREYEG